MLAIWAISNNLHMLLINRSWRGFLKHTAFSFSIRIWMQVCNTSICQQSEICFKSLFQKILVIKTVLSSSFHLKKCTCISIRKSQMTQILIKHSVSTVRRQKLISFKNQTQIVYTVPWQAESYNWQRHCVTAISSLY